MKKIKKIKHRVAALVMSFFLALGLTTPAFNISVKAEALEVANNACTLADMIFSYCASGGVAVMNETVIDEVYNVLGTSFGTLQTFVDNGLLTYSNGQYVDSGLSSSISSAIENVSSIDIGALFAQTAEQNPAGVALTGATSLAGIAGSVATTGVLPIVAGVAVSGYCGFQIGTIIANMLGLYNKPLGLGVEINSNESVLNKFRVGQSVTVVYRQGSSRRIEQYVFGDGVSFAFYQGNQIRFGIFNNSNKAITVYKYNYNINNPSDSDNLSYNISAYGGYADVIVPDSNGVYVSANNIFNSSAEYESAVEKWRNGTAQPKGNRSPDVIGQDGNVNGSVENGSYVFPSVTPQVEPSTNSIDPAQISKDDWKNYAQAVKTNNNSDIDDNPNVYQNIMNRIVLPSPTPSPEPEPEPNPDPNPNPDPETVPLPDVNPYPDSYPVADPDTVPDNKPQPEYTEKATENETDIVEGDPYTTPDLFDKFPFCIPRDILRAFKKLDSGSREAPHIQWRFHPNEMIDYTFDIDFSTWDNVAVLLRLLELIAFIVLLGIATRNLILS